MCIYKYKWTPALITSSNKNGNKQAKKKACKVNGRRVQAFWTAPSNDVVDYRVFVNNANVNGGGNRVASGTTYTTYMYMTPIKV